MQIFHTYKFVFYCHYHDCYYLLGEFSQLLVQNGRRREVSTKIECGGVVRISSLKVNYALIVMGKSGFHLFVCAAFGMEMKKNGSLFI